LLNRWNEALKEHPTVAGGLLILITFVVFQGTLANGFVYDDGKQLLENPFVRNPHLWSRIFTGSVWSFLGGKAQGNFYRPLHIFSHWLVYRLAGPDPCAFHLFQLLLYATTAAVIFRLGAELLQSAVAGFVGALLWGLHPLHVEPVAWIAGLPDVGCGLFYLLAFWLFLHAEKAEHHRLLRHGLAALVYFPALFFKEMALSFPLLLLAYWFFLPSKDSQLDKAARWLLYLAAAAGYVGIRIAVIGHLSETPHFWKVSLRVVAAGVGLLGQHAKIFFWPANLNDFRTFDLNASLRSPWPWLTLLALAAACWLRKRQPALGFPTIWWAVTLLPCLDIRQLSFPLLAERFSYLPSAGFCLAMAFLGLSWLPQRSPQRRLAPIGVAMLAVIMFFWATQDLRTIPNWRDNETLWSYSLRASPNAGLVHVHRALVLQFRERDLEGAVREYETALRLNQASFQPLSNVTYDSYLGLGQIANLNRHEEEALRYFDNAVRTAPHNSEAFNFLGSMYFPREDYAKAAEYFERAVEANQYDLGARFYLGTCWMKLGKPRQAAEQFHAAREVDPTYSQAFEAEARALEAAGDAAAAVRVRSLRPNP
jgi:tetratricopeptide (TPR) repeat protein